MYRLVLSMACVLALWGCSPEFDWRTVNVADGVISGVLPAKPQAETREVNFDGHALNLTMTMAQAGSVLFALGHAPLSDTLREDPPAARNLARGVIRSFYDGLGVPPPDPLPEPGERFVIDGKSAGKSMHLEAVVAVSKRDLMEAIVTAEPEAFHRAPAQDFWHALRMQSGER